MIYDFLQLLFSCHHLNISVLRCPLFNNKSNNNLCHAKGRLHVPAAWELLNQHCNHAGCRIYCNNDCRLFVCAYFVSLIVVFIQITPLPQNASCLFFRKYCYISVHKSLFASLDDIGFCHWFILVETNVRLEKQIYFLKI